MQSFSIILHQLQSDCIDGMEQRNRRPPSLKLTNVEQRQSKYGQLRESLKPIHRCRASSTKTSIRINQVIGALATILAKATEDEFKLDWAYVIALVETIMDKKTASAWKSSIAKADPTIGALIEFLRLQLSRFPLEKVSQKEKSCHRGRRSGSRRRPAAQQSMNECEIRVKMVRLMQSAFETVLN